MQKDSLFLGMFMLIMFTVVSWLSVLVYTVSQKSASSGEEKVQEQLTTLSNLFEIVGVHGNKLYIKNIGTADIRDIKVYIDGSEVQAKFNVIEPNSVGNVSIPKISGKKIKVVSGDFSQEFKLTGNE